MSKAQRIDAPRKVQDAVTEARKAVERINLEIQAMEFGARAALDIPDAWLWDGTGWSAPDEGQQNLPEN